jgi:copper chaperone CopZ
MMKKLLFLSLFLFGFMAVVSAQKPPKSETLTIKTRIYCDHCLKCGSCAGKMNLALRKYPGVKKININPEANTITVVYNPKKTNPEKIRKSISDAGFDADEVKANPTAVEALDECCKAK